MTEQTEKDVMEISNIDQLAFGITQWFDENHAQLDQLMDVPDGTAITVQFSPDTPEEEMTLTGDLLKGFKAGIIVAMALFDKLPFEVDVVPQDDTPVAPVN